MQVSNDTESVIDTAGRGIAGIDYRVLVIAHHYYETYIEYRKHTRLYQRHINTQNCFII